MAAPTTPTGVAWRRLVGFNMDISGVPVIGTRLLIEPNATRITDSSSTPKAQIDVTPVEGQYGADQVLRDASGAEGVWIVDPNTATLSPTAYNLKITRIVPGIATNAVYNIDIPEGTDGSDVDLADVTPVGANFGVPNVKGDPGDPGADSTVPGPPGAGVPDTSGASANDLIVWTGTVTEWTQFVIAMISDATGIGKGILAAADAAAVRALIGAGTGNGTSNLVIGTTTGTAADGATVATNTGGAREKVAALSATTGTCTGNLANASIFTITPTGDWTLAFSNVPASGTSCLVTVIVTESATIRTMTQPAGVKAMGAALPTATASKARIYNYETVNGGTTWYVSAAVEQ